MNAVRCSKFLLGLALAPMAQAQSAAVVAQHPVYPSGDASVLGQQIRAVLADPSVSRAHWGIAVTAIDGTPLYGYEEGQYFRPASNAKLYTTVAAMALLGPQTRVTTVVSADVLPDADGVLHGDLVLHGVGDANLSGRRIPYESPTARKEQVAAEKAAQWAEEKAAAARARAEALATMKKQGTVVDSFTERELAEAENEAVSAIRDKRVPPELGPIEDLAAQVVAAGVKRLTGAVVGDNDLWHSPEYAPSWDAGDAVWGYGAAVSALVFNDSQAMLVVTPGAKSGDPASLQLAPDIGALALTDEVTTVAAQADANVEAEDGPVNQRVVVRGAVAVGHADTEEIAAPNPALYAVDAFMSRLLAHGITGGSGTLTHSSPVASQHGFQRQVNEPVDLTLKADFSPVCGRDFPCGVVLAKHESPTVAEDVVVTLKVSQNLHAEMLLRRMGRAYGTEGSFAQGVRVMRQFLIKAGLDRDDFFFYDGSGLSSHDLVTPRATAQLLTYAARQPWFQQWKAGLTVGGDDGSLAGRFTAPPLKDHVFAKTGTLGETRALAGYVDCASGRQVIFSVMVDTHTPTSSAERVAMDKIVAAIAAAE